MFQKSVLKNTSQDESLVALRWAEYQKYLEKLDYIETVKEEKYQDGFLKDVVDFKVINIMDKFAFKRLGKFDVIFSRNMLIYFDDLSRKEVAMNFYNSLKVGGFVFLGHAESMNRIVSVFKTVKLGDSIIYQKG